MLSLIELEVNITMAPIKEMKLKDFSARLIFDMNLI